MNRSNIGGILLKNIDTIHPEQPCPLPALECSRLVDGNKNPEREAIAQEKIISPSIKLDFMYSSGMLHSNATIIQTKTALLFKWKKAWIFLTNGAVDTKTSGKFFRAFPFNSQCFDSFF